MEREIAFIIYTRKQALADGVLVDVTKTAKEAGFVIPVAVTQGVWATCVAVRGNTDFQDEAGRLWDVLCMLYFAVKRGMGEDSDVRYSLYVQNTAGAPTELVSLRAVCGPDDDGAPCITVMLPDED